MTGPQLPPIIAASVARFLADACAVETTVARFGSPVNVVFPQIFADNVAAIRAVLDTHRASARICYAHKANQAAAFVVQAYRCGIGIDVASPGELAGARAAGFPAERIEATGPKGESFLRQLLDAGVVVNVDNMWELSRICELSRAYPPIPLLLRLSGFDAPTEARPASRFGIDTADAEAALALVAEPDSGVELRGVSFHLDSGDIGERARAVAGCLEVIEQAYALGLRPAVLDIGGGFRQAFSADPQRFQNYVRALIDGLNGVGPALARHGHTFGHRQRGGKYAGVPSFHKYGNDIGGPAFLAELLSAPVNGRELAAALGEALLELWLEPGKALLDNAGITIATVQFTKRLADGTMMVNLDIARDTITPADQEVMLDPVICYRRRAEEYGGPCGVFFGGQLCLERDFVTRRQVWLERLPLPGDQVVFVNTAAYQMDLSATSALMHPLPPKVVAHEHRNGFTVELDELGPDKQ